MDIKTKIKLSGLSCSACQKVVENRIKKIDGVKEVFVDIETGNVEIKADKIIEKSKIVNVLEGTDYKLRNEE